MDLVSIVIPVFNESENVDSLVGKVETALQQAGLPFELLLVDDGSRDGTVTRLLDLSKTRPWLRPLVLARNYGQATALQAGFDHAKGKYIVTLDGDLQNDPADIPMMISILDTQPAIDCVSGWRRARQDATFSRKIPSFLANRLISWVTKVKLNDYGCALKAYRREIITNLRLYGELHRFIPALASEAGARIIEVPVAHHPRLAGRSNYGIDRITRVLLDLLWVRFVTRFLHRPIHLFGGLGLLLFSPGVLILLRLGYEKIVFQSDIGTRPLLFLGVLFTLVGLQLLATGVVGEILIRVYHEPQGRSQYILRELAHRQVASKAKSN